MGAHKNRRKPEVNKPELKVVEPVQRDRDITNLKFVQVLDAVMIPRYLMDQVKGLPWPVDNFYKYFHFHQGPFSFLYAMVDQTKQEIVGVVWFVVLPMCQALVINLLSLDKTYQQQGFIEKKFEPWMQDNLKKSGLSRVMWSTTHANALERLGYQSTGLTVMEGIQNA